MIIGIPKELKNNEFRVAATPSGVHAYVVAGHKVLVEKNAGAGSAISDDEYVKAGASNGSCPSTSTVSYAIAVMPESIIACVQALFAARCR